MDFFLEGFWSICCRHLPLCLQPIFQVRRLQARFSGLGMRDSLFVLRQSVANFSSMFT